MALENQGVVAFILASVLTGIPHFDRRKPVRGSRWIGRSVLSVLWCRQSATNTCAILSLITIEEETMAHKFSEGQRVKSWKTRILRTV